MIINKYQEYYFKYMGYMDTNEVKLIIRLFKEVYPNIKITDIKIVNNANVKITDFDKVKLLILVN